MPLLVCEDCGEHQRLDADDFVACRDCSSSNLSPSDAKPTRT
jgi:DNA-directed RNA polymerase subunit RPC12/RpoP